MPYSQSQKQQQQQYQQQQQPSGQAIRSESFSLWIPPQSPLCENSDRFSSMGEHAFNALWDEGKGQRHSSTARERPASAGPAHGHNSDWAYGTDNSQTFIAYAQSPTGKVRPLSAVSTRCAEALQTHTAAPSATARRNMTQHFGKCPHLSSSACILRLAGCVACRAVVNAFEPDTDGTKTTTSYWTILRPNLQQAPR